MGKGGADNSQDQVLNKTNKKNKQSECKFWQRSGRRHHKNHNNSNDFKHMMAWMRIKTLGGQRFRTFEDCGQNGSIFQIAEGSLHILAELCEVCLDLFFPFLKRILEFHGREAI